MNKIAIEEDKPIMTMLEELDTKLNEIENQVYMIADAVYRGCEPTTQSLVADGEREMMVKAPPMAVIIKNQVKRVDILLKEIVKIREAMW